MKRNGMQEMEHQVLMLEEMTKKSFVEEGVEVDDETHRPDFNGEAAFKFLQSS